jgi:hypothetical protein
MPDASSQQDKKTGLGIFTKSHPTLDTQAFQRVHDFILQDQSSKLLPKERVRFCLKNRIDKTKNRNVMFNEERSKMHWGNVQRCGSIWTCPVCAKQITEKRREELLIANRKWSQMGNYLYMITLTNSHNTSHDLNFLKLSQRKAMTRFFKGRKAESLMSDLGKKYHITNYEVTYGLNGWHPHHHILVFSDRYLGITAFSELEIKLKEHWINCCKLSGLPLPSMQHGLDLCDGTFASQYISKWGLEYEMTKGHIKKGRKQSFTPFDLLQLSITDSLVHHRESSKLFQEFAISFKGARQLSWSRGLKKLFGLNDVDDQQIVDDTDKKSIQVYDVPSLMFYLLNKYQKRHEFIECLNDDWSNECFGSGTAEQLIVDLIELEESKLDEFDGEFYSKILRVMA